MMSNNQQIHVMWSEITILKIKNEDYICITDMLKSKDREFFISDWLRNRNTIEFLWFWEEVNNPDFNYGGFATIKNKVWLNNYKMSIKERSEKTNAIWIVAKAGRYWWTYAHKDIAFEFWMWISPKFKIYLIKEFQNRTAIIQMKSLINEKTSTISWKISDNKKKLKKRHK